MTAPYLGGYRITKTEWTGSNAVRVDFVSTEFPTLLWQAYVSKTLVNVTDTAAQRSIIVDVPSGDRPAPLTLVAVTVANKLTDYSSRLPVLPWSLYCVTWQNPTTPPADIHHFDVVAGTTAGGAFDSTNILGRVLYDAAATSYQFTLPQFSTNGDWSIAVIPRDDAETLGNAGTEASDTISVFMYPKDVLFDSQGRRFSVAVAAGEMTASFLCP